VAEWHTGLIREQPMRLRPAGMLDGSSRKRKSSEMLADEMAQLVYTLCHELL
jgi:hypothetical protein